MVNCGDIVSLNTQKSGLVIEVGERHIHLLPLMLAHGKTQGYYHLPLRQQSTEQTDISEIVDLGAVQVVTHQDVVEVIDRLSKADFEHILKQRVLLATRSYYQGVHKEKELQAFVAGESRVNYAGRVFDSSEMENLIDASLEFYLTAGRYDAQFCKDMSSYLQSDIVPRINVLTVNSGSSANLVALSALTSPKLKELALSEGDEVICVAAGFPTSIAPIVQNRLVPVFIDVELGTYNIDCSKIEASIRPKTKAIMIAHTLGTPFDLDRVLEIAEKHQLWVIEDNCDALGASYELKREYHLIKNKRVSGKAKTGTIGHIGTSSFYPAHQITMGEGGAVYTYDKELYRIALSIRDWGRDCWCNPGRDNTCKKRFGWQLGLLPRGYDHKYTYSHIGYNLKITDMQAAVGVAQLARIQSFADKRLANWLTLREGLEKLSDAFILPDFPQQAIPSPFGFPLTVRSGFNREQIVHYLEKHNIQTRTVFAGNMLRQPAFTDSDVKVRIQGGDVKRASELTETEVSSLVNTDTVMRDTFWVGVYPGLTTEMIDYMIAQIKTSIGVFS